MFCRGGDEEDVTAGDIPLRGDLGVAWAEPERCGEVYVLGVPLPRRRAGARGGGAEAEFRARRRTLRSVLRAAARAGLSPRAVLADDRSALLLALAAPTARLEAEADRLNYALRADAGALRGTDIAANASRAPLVARGDRTDSEIRDAHGASRLDPYGHIYAPFDSDVAARLPRLYRIDAASRSSAVARAGAERCANGAPPRAGFSNADAARLVGSIVRAPAPAGAALDVDKLLQTGRLSDAFAVHDYTQLAELKGDMYQWCQHPWQLVSRGCCAHVALLGSRSNPCPVPQPLARMQAYFGQSVALYFAFLAHNTRLLVWPAAIGLAVWVHQLAVGVTGVPELPVFALYIGLWSTWVVESWKRAEASLAMRWGTA